MGLGWRFLIFLLAPHSLPPLSPFPSLSPATIIENVLAPAVALPSAEHAQVAQAATAFEEQLPALGLVVETEIEADAEGQPAAATSTPSASELRAYVAGASVNHVNRRRQELLDKARTILTSSNNNVVTVEHATEPGALFDAAKLAEQGLRTLRPAGEKEDGAGK